MICRNARKFIVAHDSLASFNSHYHVISTSFHIVFHRIGSMGSPPLQPRLNRHGSLLEPQLLSQLHALHGPTAHLQPPDGVTHYITSYHVSAIISYCIISFDIVSFDIDSIPSICTYIYILYILYQLVLCTPYYITHIISNHFPKSSFEIQLICRDNSFQENNGKFIGRKKGTEFQGYHQFNTLRMTSSHTPGTARN